MKLGFIGIGKVGFALANGLQNHGHTIYIGHNDPKSPSITAALDKNPNFQILPIHEMVKSVEIVFLATPFAAAEGIVSNIDFNGKILVDCTNPVGPGISHGLNSKISGTEKIEQRAKGAKVVKAFSIYGFENFQDLQNSQFSKQPVMLIAGNDLNSKKMLTPLISELGFEVKDTGPLDQALHLEHMTLLWVKMVRRDGHHPNFVWAYSER